MIKWLKKECLVFSRASKEVCNKAVKQAEQLEMGCPPAFKLASSECSEVHLPVPLAFGTAEAAANVNSTSNAYVPLDMKYDASYDNLPKQHNSNERKKSGVLSNKVAPAKLPDICSSAAVDCDKGSSTMPMVSGIDPVFNDNNGQMIAVPSSSSPKRSASGDDPLASSFGTALYMQNVNSKIMHNCPGTPGAFSPTISLHALGAAGSLFSDPESLANQHGNEIADVDGSEKSHLQSEWSANDRIVQAKQVNEGLECGRIPQVVREGEVLARRLYSPRFQLDTDFLEDSVASMWSMESSPRDIRGSLVQSSPLEVDNLCNAACGNVCHAEHNARQHLNAQPLLGADVSGVPQTSTRKVCEMQTSPQSFRDLQQDPETHSRAQMKLAHRLATPAIWGLVTNHGGYSVWTA